MTEGALHYPAPAEPPSPARRLLHQPAQEITRVPQLSTGPSVPPRVSKVDWSWLSVRRERAFTCSSPRRGRAAFKAPNLPPLCSPAHLSPPVWTAVRGCPAVTVARSPRPHTSVCPRPHVYIRRGDLGTPPPMPTGLSDCVTLPNIQRIRTTQGNSPDCRTGSDRARRLSLGQVP
ncbi:unnamed protein product [Pleuronectes platessa]|uniref:Uncharacterized protein n=1 Tax=Pleuronectes platessa TaxID=8262 RepID=A0A9N7TVI8_PLEPL|nr:unnamed protein product [Pleuronectes platessa]